MIKAESREIERETERRGKRGGGGGGGGEEERERETWIDWLKIFENKLIPP